MTEWRNVHVRGNDVSKIEEIIVSVLAYRHCHASNAHLTRFFRGCYNPLLTYLPLHFFYIYSFAFLSFSCWLLHLLQGTSLLITSHLFLFSKFKQTIWTRKWTLNFLKGQFNHFIYATNFLYVLVEILVNVVLL